ncbi:hypothetical protein PAPYR_4632 [Paratrimastix pyriformis]|uniref:Uncharacterized protein n=1 Tax=Paratrimastix pyriformis TaxID=342808 RepID=A0ABQ8ULL3_9EUKA|nr:hypothetical protein PAPYR_4632 [Paratrimastix pyriformis]
MEKISLIQEPGPKIQPPPVAAVDLVDVMPLLLRLSPELFSTMVEHSASPLLTYMQLLSLCRATRTAVRGTPRELSFCFDDDDDGVGLLVAEVTVPTPDALAALVGPCKGLVKLTLPGGDEALLPLGRLPEEAVCAPWVSEAFGGHDRLAVLEVPSVTSLLLLPAIVSHLPGLVELRIGGPDPDTVLTRGIPLKDPERKNVPDSLSSAFLALLEALGQSCPSLRVLHQTAMQLNDTDTDDYVLPNMEQLTDIHLLLGGPGDVPVIPEFIAQLTSVQRLTLDWCQNAYLRPIAPRLTHLRLVGPVFASGAGLAKVGLCQLESIQMNPGRAETLSKLVSANRNTLRSVILDFDEAAIIPPLNDLPHLTDLTLLFASRKTPPHILDAIFAHLTPELLDRLEHLAVHLHCNGCLPTGPTIRLASRRLRTLCLGLRGLQLSETTLELACPCLEALVLPEPSRDDPADLGGLELDCPQLRSIEGLPGTSCKHWAVTAMPHLARVRGIRSQPVLASYLLTPIVNVAPRLRDLSPTVDVTKAPDLLARLLASDTLTRLSLSLDAPDLPTHCCAAHSPDDLDYLRPRGPGFELVVDAPGLRSLTLHVSSSCGVRVVLRCPALVALDLRMPPISHCLVDPTTPPLVDLALVVPADPFGAESWVADLVPLLGTRLRRVCIEGPYFGWSQVFWALNQLPSLADLRLRGLASSADLRLLCPALKRLTLLDVRFRLLQFDCPQLEVLAIRGPLDCGVEPLWGLPPDMRLDLGPLTPRRLAERLYWMERVPFVRSVYGEDKQCIYEDEDDE